MQHFTLSTSTSMTPSATSISRRALLGGTLANMGLALTACSSSSSHSSHTHNAAPATTGGKAVSGALAVTDPWCKAAAASEMTAVFATVRNPGKEEVVITGASTPAAHMTQLHETVTTTGGGMQMRELQGGLHIPAGGSVTLEPGGRHVMLMGLTRALRPGDQVTLTLHTQGHGDVTVTAPVKAFTGAKENYEPSDGGH